MRSPDQPQPRATPLGSQTADRCCPPAAAPAQCDPAPRLRSAALWRPRSFFPSASACGPFKHGGAGAGGEVAWRREPGAPAQPAAGCQLGQLRPAAGPVLAPPASHPLPQRALLQQRGRVRDLPQDRVPGRRARAGAGRRPSLRGLHRRSTLQQDPPPCGRRRPGPRAHRAPPPPHGGQEGRGRGRPGQPPASGPEQEGAAQRAHANALWVRRARTRNWPAVREVAAEGALGGTVGAWRIRVCTYEGKGLVKVCRDSQRLLGRGVVLEYCGKWERSCGVTKGPHSPEAAWKKLERGSGAMGRVCEGNGCRSAQVVGWWGTCRERLQEWGAGLEKWGLETTGRARRGDRRSWGLQTEEVVHSQR